MKKLKFIEINYHCHQKMTVPADVIQKHQGSNLFAKPLLQKADVTLVKHMNYKGELDQDGIHYYFSRRSNYFLQIPFSTHRFIQEQNPDLLLVQGFVFPIQVMALRKKLGNKPIILLQHHGELPAGKKRFFQKLADNSVDGYVFSALGNAEPWLNKEIIRDREKCFELPSSSTLFEKQEKTKSRPLTGMKNEGIHFLWIGRLDKNKDPITILEGFEKYLLTGKKGTLWMVYQETDLLHEIQNLVEKSSLLKNNVRLMGKLPNKELIYWYSAADYYISGSWHEGGSYALTEAMACGCVPIVTNIPAAMKTIDAGKYGYFFEPGNVEQLGQLLTSLNPEKDKEMSIQITDYFSKNLSPTAVSESLMKIYTDLKNRV